MNNPPMREMRLASIHEGDDPVQIGRLIILETTEGDQQLPIWIGMHEGDAINAVLAGVEPQRPQTHDLLRSALDAFNGRVDRVVITDHTNDTFFAEIVVDDGHSARVIDARPSDAVALAVRCDARIFAAESVLERASLANSSISGTVVVAPSGRTTIRSDADDAREVLVTDHLARRYRLRGGDLVGGRSSRGSNNGEDPSLVLVHSVNGRPLLIYREPIDHRLPVVVPTPNDWFELHPPPSLSRFGRNFLPFGAPFGTLIIGGRSTEVGDITAQAVLDRVFAECDGAYELLDDDDVFSVPGGFEATALTRTTREIRTNAQPGRLLEWWYSMEGVTTRWIVAVRAGIAIIMVLEGADWEKARPLQDLLSRCELADLPSNLGGLTAREREVLTYMVGGATNPEIGKRLHISPHTVAKHVKSILAKLEAANRTEAASTAILRGIVDSSRN